MQTLENETPPGETKTEKALPAGEDHQQPTNLRLQPEIPSPGPDYSPCYPPELSAFPGSPFQSHSSKAILNWP